MSDEVVHGVTADLVDSARAGDRRGLDKLVERFTPQLRRYLQRRVVSDMSVDDLFQETQLEAFKSLPNFRYRKTGSYLAWLYTIAHRRLAREYERRSRAVPVLRLRPPNSGGTTQNLLAGLAAPDTSPADRAERGQVFELMGQALAELANNRRDAILLRYFEQHDNASAAALMGMTTETFRTCLSRARRQLADVLDAALEGDN